MSNETPLNNIINCATHVYEFVSQDTEKLTLPYSCCCILYIKFFALSMSKETPQHFIIGNANL